MRKILKTIRELREENVALRKENVGLRTQIAGLENLLSKENTMKNKRRYE